MSYRKSPIGSLDRCRVGPAHIARRAAVVGSGAVGISIGIGIGIGRVLEGADVDGLGWGRVRRERAFSFATDLLAI